MGYMWCSYELMTFIVKYDADIMLLPQNYLAPHLRVSFHLILTIGRNNLQQCHVFSGGRLYWPTCRHHLDTSQISHQMLHVGTKHRWLRSVPCLSISPPVWPAPLPGEWNALFDHSLPTIIAGDLIMKHPSWSCRTFNFYSRYLQRFDTDNSDILIISPDDPTFFQTGKCFQCS